MPVDFYTEPLYAGICGAELEMESFDLGHGVTISRTYAHVMLPMLMAFSQPLQPGSHHPGPWKTMSGGGGFDILVQLYIPSNFAPSKWFDRLNTIWWFAALTRLKATPEISVPVVTHLAFDQIATADGEPTLLPVEVSVRKARAKLRKTTLAKADLQWLGDHWLKGGRLVGSNEAFATAIQAFDSTHHFNGTTSLALLTLWGALERLFSPAKQELRFRVSASIASFLEPPGAERLKLHRKILKLYDARSEAAHGYGRDHTDPLTETYALTRRVLLRLIENGHVPSKDQIDELLFSDQQTEAEQ